MIWWMSAWAAPCIDVADTLGEARNAVLDVEMDAARHALGTLETNIGCAALLTPEDAALAHALRGVLAILEGDEEGSTAGFAPARAVAPALDLGDFGSSVQDAFESVALSEVSLTVRGMGAAKVYVDGQPASDTVVAGRHLIQVVHDGEVYDGLVFDAFPGEPVGLELPAPPVQVAVGPKPEDPPPVTKPRKPVKPLLPIGIACAATGVGALLFSVERQGAMANSQSLSGLQTTYRMHQISRVAGLGLLATGTVLTVRGAF